MKKTVSVVYTVFVVVVLLAVIGYFGWETYQSRGARISDFTTRTEGYVRQLGSQLEAERDVNGEVELAERIMADDASLIAIQIHSPDDGLRLSVVKGPAEEFGRTALADSERFTGFPARIRYHMVRRPLAVEGMPELEASFVASTLSGGEIRNNLLILLVTVLGLFVITLVLILVRPREAVESDEMDSNEDHDEQFTVPEGFDMHSPAEEEFSLPDMDDSDDLDAHRLDESDLLSSRPEFGETLEVDDDFDLPDLDGDAAGAADAVPHGDLVDRLDLELDRAASFNQDLSLLIFTGGIGSETVIRDAYTYADLIFALENGDIAVIELNRGLDATLAMTEDVLRRQIDMTGNRDLRAGIASRNGRLISAQRLYGEAESALRKTDEDKNIVAFRSDPEKYREYLKNQEG